MKMTDYPDRINISPVFRQKREDDFYLVDRAAFPDKGTEYVRADLHAALEARLAEAKEKTLALRKIIAGAGVNLWDRAEISERDEAGNQTLLLWHPSGKPLIIMSIKSHAPKMEAAHRDLVMSDLLDVLTARAALAKLEQNEP